MARRLGCSGATCGDVFLGHCQRTLTTCTVVHLGLNFVVVSDIYVKVTYTHMSVTSIDIGRIRTTIYNKLNKNKTHFQIILMLPFVCHNLDFCQFLLILLKFCRLVCNTADTHSSFLCLLLLGFCWCDDVLKLILFIKLLYLFIGNRHVIWLNMSYTRLSLHITYYVVEVRASLIKLTG